MNVINWQDTYRSWKTQIYFTAPELLKPVLFEHIQFKYEETTHSIYGYDWLHNDEYEKRIKSVAETPIDFLLFGESLNKGTLQTAEYFAEAKDDSEQLALIWIYSFVTDLLNDLPENLRGDGHRWLQGIQFGIYPELQERNIKWNHSMRKLLPEEYYSYIYDNLELKGIEPIIELAMISAKLIYNNYTIYLYDSYRTKT